MPVEIDPALLLLGGVFGGTLLFFWLKLMQSLRASGDMGISLRSSDVPVWLLFAFTGATAAYGFWALSEAASRPPLVYVVAVLAGIAGTSILNTLINTLVLPNARVVPEFGRLLEDSSKAEEQFEAIERRLVNIQGLHDEAGKDQALSDLINELRNNQRREI